MNYLQQIFDAVDAALSTDVYTISAPQGTTVDHVVIVLQGVTSNQSKDWAAGHTIAATLFFHYADADTAQADLATTRTSLKASNSYMESFQAFHDDINERVILAADFNLILNN
tara:strand:- start:545 stop:883 length:339 start_codon:yes stop_codon:yes gene_type:complete